MLDGKGSEMGICDEIAHSFIVHRDHPQDMSMIETRGWDPCVGVFDPCLNEIRCCCGRKRMVKKPWVCTNALKGDERYPREPDSLWTT